MHLKKMFKDIKRCKGNNDWRIKWDVKFLIDDDFLFALLPTILFQPSIYRYPGTSIIDIWWLNMHLVFGEWMRKEEEK